MSRDYTPKLQLNASRGSLTRLRSPERKTVGCINSSPIIKYVLAAEFDIKVGSVVKHQIPRKVPGFKEHLGTLGELMIPSSSEHMNESYSVFILYKDTAGKYRLLPDTDKDILEEGSLGFQSLSLNEISTIFEKTTSDDDVLFFFTATKSVRSKANERGRVIRAVSIGTPLRNFAIFKHLLTLTIQLYIQDGSMSHLVSVFNTINSTDISMWKHYIMANSHLHNLLSLNYEFNNRIILTHFKNIETKDLTSQSVKYRNGTLQYFPQHDLSKTPEDAVMAKIPIPLSLSMHPTEILTDLKVSNAILKFLHDLSAQLNKIEYKNLNILIYSTSQVDFLTSFILTLSNFLNGFNKTYFHNDKILYFPLIDLYSWEKLLEFDKHTKNMKVIGTNNVILKDSSDFYDFFYDLDTEKLTVSEKLETFELSLPKTHDFMTLTKTLLTQQQDYETVRVSLQRFNLREIIKILKRDDTEQAEVNLKDYYLSMNKNLVLFDEFFEFKTIRLIDTFVQLFGTIKKGLRQLSNEDVDTLKSCYDMMYTYVNTATSGRVEMFLYLLEIMPLEIESPEDLIFDAELTLQNQTLLSDVLKPLLIKDESLQRKVWRLYSVLSKSMLRVILEQRLNVFVRVMMEEYAAKLKRDNV